MNLIEDAGDGERAIAVLTGNLLGSTSLWRRGARRRAVTLLSGTIEGAPGSDRVGPIFDWLHLIEPLLVPLQELGQLGSATRDAGSTRRRATLPTVPLRDPAG